MSDARVGRSAGTAVPGHAAGPRIEVGAFGVWRANAYVVWDGRSADALVLDPGQGAATPLVARLAEIGLTAHVVANSHGHIDHTFDNAAMVRLTGAPLAIHPDDAHRLDGRNSFGFAVEPSHAERDLREGEQLRIGDLVWDVLHTPGHTKGSVCLYEQRHALLLSGDTLFPGGWGRTDLAGGDEESMVASLGRLARELPPAVRVLPGHGAETTIERELSWMRRVAQTGRLALP